MPASRTAAPICVSAAESSARIWSIARPVSHGIVTVIAIAAVARVPLNATLRL